MDVWRNENLKLIFQVTLQIGTKMVTFWIFVLIFVYHCQGFLSIDSQLVVCETTASTEHIILELRKDWAPIGVERFIGLVEDGFFTNSPLFRVVKGFLVQFGIAEKPSKTHEWRSKGTIPDDDKSLAPPPPFKRGYLSFAGGGKDSRGTELFIAYRDSTHLGKSPWEVPIGFVLHGMDVVDSFFADYGDIHPYGNAPRQGRMYKEGNAYLKQEFPKLDYIKSCHIMRGISNDDEDWSDDAESINPQNLSMDDTVDDHHQDYQDIPQDHPLPDPTPVEEIKTISQSKPQQSPRVRQVEESKPQKKTSNPKPNLSTPSQLGVSPILILVGVVALLGVAFIAKKRSDRTKQSRFSE